jgi:hypothetical protein
MSLLVQEMIKDLLPEGNKKTTAVYGGGFKPPTAGHFEVVTTALKKNPNIDEFIILIGGKERDGITQSDSLLIWEIYKQYLPINVNVITDSKPPIQGVYNYAKEHPNEDVIFVIGAREGNEEDFSDITNRTKSVNNYPNLRVETVVTQGGVSGTAARNAAKISFEKFRPFVPSELTDEEAREVFDIVSQNIKEILNENASYSNEINVKNEIAKLTKHMIGKGMNIEPLPKLIFKNGDKENAKQFLGKTAYYDPNNQSIVLYTEGRHPKDIVRSFAHEMIHHIQNLEGRLGEITTTNTQEDDHLDKLEQEANLKGTMTFRNWTDSLNEAIVGDRIVCDNCGWNWPIKDGGDDLFICHKCGHDNNPDLDEGTCGYNTDVKTGKKLNTPGGLKENKNKDPFGINAYARELAMLREEDPKSKIYVDMDGVVADFDKRFTVLAGMGPKEFEEKYGKNAFWDFIDEGDNKLVFWVGIPPMPDAQQLMNFVSNYDYEMLTAPSLKKQSVMGKGLWMKNQTNKGLFSSKPKVNYKSAKTKKDFAAPNHILIDDREDTINSWRAEGGIGILHTSAASTINQLKKLGL